MGWEGAFAFSVPKNPLRFEAPQKEALKRHFGADLNVDQMTLSKMSPF